MGAQVATPPGRGPYCFRVHGQIYHHTSHLHPFNNEQRQYAQLYVVSSAEATARRMNNPANHGCIAEVVSNIDRLIWEHNVFANAFKTLHEVELREEQQAHAERREQSTVNITSNRDRNADRRRYNIPTVDEIAIVFQTSEGEPPFNRDFKVYPRAENNPLINLNVLRGSSENFGIFFIIAPILLKFSHNM